MSRPVLACTQMRRWFREGDENRLSLSNVPYPVDKDGNDLPHGSVLDFQQMPIALHPRTALVWWLRLRNVNVPMSYPMEPFE